jgi:hypothetical protein
MPGQTKFFLFRINGKLATFVFCFVSDGILLDYYLGFDYELAHEYHLYFVKFKEVTNWCLAHGIKTYEIGQICFKKSANHLNTQENAGKPWIIGKYSIHPVNAGRAFLSPRKN